MARGVGRRAGRGIVLHPKTLNSLKADFPLIVTLFSTSTLTIDAEVHGDRQPAQNVDRPTYRRAAISASRF